MQSWPRPQVPALASPADESATLRLYDTASGRLVDAAPESDTARLYVCGITPYDATHLGHAATYLAFDLVQRQWRDMGFEVHYVQNVTDVDDPLLERADATGQDWVALAERETQLFRDDMTALRVLPPDDYIGAVESIPMVLDMIDRLHERGAVYHVDDDLYFDVTTHPNFGSLSGFDRDTMVALFGERGGDPQRAGKRNALDCLLWQAERPGEPAWESDWGKGRPGWHIECAAIALTHLGVAFDIQGGGSDLVFPHHEMSAAQASVDTGQPFARNYLHAGMVGYQGEKMSKSKGNLVLVSALRNAGHDPMVIRLALLAHHYREDWEWFDTELAEAQKRWEKWTAAFGRGTGPAAAGTIDALRQALRHDLDAPQALSIIDAWCASDGDDAQAPGEVAQAVDALLGIAKN